MASPNIYTYRGFRFTLAAQPQGAAAFVAQVAVADGSSGTDAWSPLPQDADAYASEAEALRHAEQQAVRWVHDRTGDGQGQF